MSYYGGLAPMSYHSIMVCGLAPMSYYNGWLQCPITVVMVVGGEETCAKGLLVDCLVWCVLGEGGGAGEEVTCVQNHS